MAQAVLNLCERVSGAPRRDCALALLVLRAGYRAAGCYEKWRLRGDRREESERNTLAHR